MKYSIIFILFTFLSCSDSSQQSENQKGTPKALKDNSSIEVYSKRSNTDLVESLYNELIDNTPELKNLEAQISSLKNTYEDSTELFNKYNSKNQSYYTAANTHIGQMNDSSLREKINKLILSSSSSYNSIIQPLQIC